MKTIKYSTPSETEEMRFHQRVVEYAIKYAIKYDNNAKVARRYHTSRQQVWRWRKEYDGTLQSLAKELGISESTMSKRVKTSGIRLYL